MHFFTLHFKIKILSKVLCFFLLFIGVENAGFAQKSIYAQELELKNLFENLGQASTDSLRFHLNEKVCQGMRKVLSNDSSFYYSFDELRRMGKIASPDGNLRLYNWNFVREDGTNQYFGFLQRKKGKNKVEIFELLEGNAKYKGDVTHLSRSRSWLGALYYQIVPFKSKGANYYLLLGWDGNDHSTTRKVIEVLHITKKGMVQFGGPLIQWHGKRLHRVVFEYAKQARMTLRYSEREKRVVFDHLSPSSPRYRGQFEYYGPDFSQDALILEKGIWKLIENVDARNAEIKKK
jgi:hypothetical protein